jgi:hypothetical protein
MKPAVFWSVASALLVGFVLAGLDLARRKSATWDETGHLTAGYSYWVNGDHRVTTNNGILAQKLAAAPLRLMPDRPRFPDAVGQAALQGNPIELGRRFLFGMGNDARALLFRGRAMIVFLAVGLGLGVLLWSRSLFGDPGALVSLALFVLSPLLLAHSALVTTDLASALTLLAATAAWWRVLQRVSPGRIAWFGFALGILILTKYSFLVFAAVAGLLGLARLLRSEPLPFRGSGSSPRADTGLRGRCGVLLVSGVAGSLVAWIVVWGAYGFRFGITGFSFDWEGLGPDTVTYRLTALLRALHLFPEPFIYDLAGLRYLGVGRGTFLHGDYSMEGFRLFFPIAFLIKSTPGFLVLAALGLAAIYSSRDGRTLAWKTLPLVALVTVYLAASVASTLNLGIRHLLPIYPPLCILTGAAVLWKSRQRALHWLGLGVALPAAAISAVRAHPDELAYTNFLGGGTAQGWRWLVGSSYDWGGELPEVARATGPNPALSNQPPNYLLYSGTADPAAYGINAIQLDGYFRPTEDFTRTLRGGTYYVCASNLQTGTPQAFGPWTVSFEKRYQELRQRPTGAPTDPDFIERHGLLVARLCSFLRLRTPDGQVAQAVLVFRLTDAEIQRVISGPPAELFPASPVRGWREPGL